jgi:hypothetical protein
MLPNQQMTPGQGVLPDPNAGNSPPSASQPWTNPTQAQNFSAGNARRPAMARRPRFDGGGILPDMPTDDNANAPSPSDDANTQPSQNTSPLDVVKQALTWGRQKMGLPRDFFGTAGSGIPTNSKPSNDSDSVNRAVQEENDMDPQHGNSPADARAMSLNGAKRQLVPGEQLGGGDTAIPYETPTQNIATGGAVEDDGDEGGVLPDGNNQQAAPQGGGQIPQPGAGGPPQQAMGYLMGKGAADAATVAALEHEADPDGTMDPNERKLKTVAMQGSPEKAFPVLQHYRQKFNAYNAFAQVAAKGTPQKPADMQASASAATKAYQHLPDGNAMHFQPTKDGMHVTVRPVHPTDSAKPAQKFEEGGIPEDTENDVTGTVNSAPTPLDGAKAIGPGEDDVDDGGPSAVGVIPQDDEDMVSKTKKDFEGLKGAASGVKKAFTPNFDNPTANALKGGYDKLLSWAQWPEWLKSHGQADAVLDKGAVSTLNDAAVQPQGTGEPENTANAPWPKPNLPGGPPAAEHEGPDADRPGGQDQGDMPLPDNSPKPFKSWKPADVSEDLNRMSEKMFPSVNQEQERLKWLAEQMKELAGRENKISVAKAQGVAKEGVARVTGNLRNEGSAAKSVSDTERDKNKDVARGERAQLGADTKMKIQSARDLSAAQRLEFEQAQKNWRGVIGASPGLAKNPAKADEIVNEVMKGLNVDKPTALKMLQTDLTSIPKGTAQGPAVKTPPAQQQAPADTRGMKFYNGQWYKRGPNGEAIPVQ